MKTKPNPAARALDRLFQSLYVKYHRLVHTRCLVYCGQAQADDLAQEVWRLAWIRFVRKEPADYYKWILTVIFDTCAEFHKQQGATPVAVGGNYVTEADPGTILATDDSWHWILSCLDKAGGRADLETLRALESGATDEQLAKRWGISLDSANDRISHARRTFSVLLARSRVPLCSRRTSRHAVS